MSTPRMDAPTFAIGERLGDAWNPDGVSAAGGVDRTSGRCFVPYVQDPPTAPR
jgi:hypothetical protein